jgi:hypothetical protein
MKYIYFFVITTLSFIGCNKENSTTQIDVISSMLTNKNWYLDYSITDNITKTYVGQITYFVTYFKEGKINDSDGLNGTYKIENIENTSQIHTQLLTINGNSLEVTYDILSISDSKLILSKHTATGNHSQLYFSSK